MSTRQRLSHETTPETMPPAPLLFARSIDAEPLHVEDIGARRLRELAQRFSQGGFPAPEDDDSALDGTDVEFEPVSLASIIALGREQSPDTPDSSLIQADEGRSPIVPFVAFPSAPAPEAANDAAPPAALPAIVSIAPAEPLRLASDEFNLPAEAAIAEPVEAEEEPVEPAIVTIVEPVSEQEAAPTSEQPLMLADQSAPDIRLVDLIRRQQTLLDQLNSFPPSYDASQHAEKETPAPRSLVEQLAPQPIVEIVAEEPEPTQETPPPLPPPAPERAPPTLSLSPPPAPRQRHRTDEPDTSELTQQSPMIIQRARAERSGRRIAAVTTPPSAVPAFFGGLAAALLVAGVLFAIL